MKISTILLLTVPVWADWNVIFYSDTGCSGKVIGHENIAAAEVAASKSSCHRPHALPTRVRSAKYSNGEHEDDRIIYMDEVNRRVRFYDNDDCSHHCSHRHAFPIERYTNCVTFPPSDGENTRTLGSFNIVENARGGQRSEGVLADGYCTFAHGDSIFFNGREWRMHQVAAAYFHEIPAEEWDDKLHTPNTTHRGAEHGDVDIYARWKIWQAEESYQQEVALENWNATKHVKRGKGHDIAEQYNYAVESLCMELTTFKSDADFDGFVKDIPNWEMACSGKTFAEWHAMRNKRYRKDEPLDANAITWEGESSPANVAVRVQKIIAGGLA